MESAQAVVRVTARRILAEITAAIVMRCIAGVAALVVVLCGTVQAQTGEELALALRDNVVQITANWRDGTSQNGFGFIVGEEDGRLVVVTANHVVRGEQVDQIAERVLVRFYQKRGHTFEATLLDTSNPGLDLAVLEVPLPSGMRPPSNFGAESAAERGMSVWFVGRGADWFVPTQPGTVNRVDEVTHEIVIENLAVQVGSSGAPLIGESGIVGMIVRDEGGDISGATRIQAIRTAMADWNFRWQLEGATESPQLAGRCSVAGRVFNTFENRYLSGVQISFLHGEDRRQLREIRRRAATTDLEGRFVADCSDIARENFPLVIELWHPDWVAHHLTWEEVAYGQERTDLNFPVEIRPRDLRFPPGGQTAPVASESGGVLTIEPRGHSASYDFRDSVIGSGPSGGDFYFSADDPGFWANNRGQRGTIDLGDLGATPLQQVRPPRAGYSDQGVPAIIGHTYVARAREGHDDDYIIFRVLDIEASDRGVDHYKIQYIYSRGSPLPVEPQATCPAEIIVPAKEISTRFRDAHIVAGDSELDSDDWTSVELNYEIRRGSRRIDLVLSWSAQERNRDKSRGDTKIQSKKTFTLFDLGALGSNCSGSRISGIVVRSESEQNEEYYRGNVHGRQPFPDTGSLRNIEVEIDRRGDHDERVLALDATFAKFTVKTQ